MYDSKFFKEQQAKFYEDNHSTSFGISSSQQVLTASFHPFYSSSSEVKADGATYVVKLDRVSYPQGSEIIELNPTERQSSLNVEESKHQMRGV